MKIIILAGGGGTRLWPLSREDYPKQFLHFGEDGSLLQKTLKRCLDTPNAEEIVISTNKQNEFLVVQQIEPNPKVHIVIEPERKNTAPAIALAVKYLEDKIKASKKDSVLVVPSDHLVDPQSVFIRHLEQLDEIIREGNIALFGIRPTKPETGYGYIQIGGMYGLFGHHVRRFVEKPDLKKAKKFIASGEYYWNAGMFGFTIETFWEEASKYAPEIGSMGSFSFEENVKRFYMMPDISIDYAMIEKCDRAVVCPLPVTWSDVGSWDSVYESLEKDENNNVKRGNILDIDTKGSLIFGGKRLVSTIGLEDLLIVETGDAIFISKKGESQRVKSLVKDLIRIGRKEGETHSLQIFPWGCLKRIEECGKEQEIDIIEVNPGQICDLTQDRSKSVWICLSDSAEAEIDGVFHQFHQYESIAIEGRSAKFLNRREKIIEFLRLRSRSSETNLVETNTNREEI